MGAWGIKTYENDRACDFIIDIIDVAFDKAEYNEDYIAVADLCISTVSIDRDMIIKLLEVVNEELTDDYLNCWRDECKEDRRKYLSEMKENLTSMLETANCVSDIQITNNK